MLRLKQTKERVQTVRGGGEGGGTGESLKY